MSDDSDTTSFRLNAAVLRKRDKIHCLRAFLSLPPPLAREAVNATASPKPLVAPSRGVVSADVFHSGGLTMDHTAHFPPTAPVRADRILVVDADADTRQVIREALITAGYEVDEAVLTDIAVLLAHRTGPEGHRTTIPAISATPYDTAANPSSSHSSSVTHPALTSYDSRRRGEYVYNIDIYESARAATADHFRAHVMNMVLLEAGRTVSVNPDLQDEYGPTPQRALSRIERAVDEWVRDHTPLH